MSFMPGGLKLLGVDYWIFEVGPDYKYTALGSPSREVLFILSRDKNMAESDYNEVIAKLKAKGFPVEKLVKIERNKK